MKTKMKSAFAFIAVALMIMVAVVPMVGVFTEDSSADAVAIPGTGKITIKGNVKDTSGNIAGAMVKVTVDSKAIYGITDNSGNYSIDVYIGGAKDIKVEVVAGNDDDDGIYAKVKGVAGAKNPVQTDDGRSFNEYTFVGVTVGLEKIDFVSGYVAVSGSLKYASGQAYTKETEITYTTGVTAGNETGISVSNSAKSIDGKYTILVPANSEGVVIKADAIEAKTDKFNVTTSSFTDKDLQASKLNLSEITVTGIPAGITSVVKVEPATGSVVSNISSLVVGEDGKIAFEYKLETLTSENNKKVKITDAKGYGAPYEVVVANTLTYNCAKFITGTIKMGDVLSLDSTPEVKLYKADKETEVTSYSVDAVINGTYYVPFGNKTIDPEVKYVKASVGSDASDFVSFTSASGKTSANIKLDDKEYSLIDGTIKCDGKAVPNVEISLSSTSAKMIGVKDGKVYTDANGKYKFYAETGKAVTIAPVGNFDVGSRTFAATKTTIDFNMKTIVLPSAATTAVTDASTPAKPLEGVSVFYKIGETGAYNTTAIKTDKDGKFKITVNSNVSADNVFVYLSDTKYTFNSNDKKPFALSSTEPNDWKANEQTNTFVVKDATGTVIKNSGIVLEVGKYKVHTAGSSTVFDLIGTKSDVTYADGVYSFVAKSISAFTGEYEDAYGISIKSNSTDYTFDAITKYTDSSFALTAKEQTIKGTVKDAANGALKGILVAVYDGETKLSKDVTTLNDGSFSVISKSGTLKAVDPNGVYTFNDVTSAATSAIVANEKEYIGVVKDADNELVENAKITVKVVDADGKTIGSVATATDKDGKYSIITKLTAGNKVVATDADGKRTFENITIGTDATAIPDVVSGQYTLSGVVKERVTAGTAKPIKDITVTLSVYSDIVDKVVVKTAVTNEEGEYSFFVNKLDTTTDSTAKYGVVATSSGNYKFSTTAIKFLATAHTADITALYEIVDGIVKEATSDKALSGIKVTAYDGTNVFGEYTTDKVGKFEYPNITGMKFKAVDPNGAYTFADEFTISSINAKENTVVIKVKANDGSSADKLPLAGVTVNFLKEKKVVKTATTDAKGNVSVIIASSAYDDVKAVDGNTAYGAMTFGDLSTDAIYADQTVYSGFYANGDVVSGVVVTYEMSNGDAYVEKGKAVVIDNKYYIASVADEADKIVITANAQGFYAVNTFNSLATIGASDLKIKEKPGIVKVDEDDVLFGEFYTVYNATNAQVGDKIILRASEVAYAPLEDGNETTVVKYKFDGWYVNGVKVSDDLEYVYTVTEDCLVYADYKASTYETASDDNGISPSVLVIGIAAVIVALIAVVYTVIQKKE